MIGKELNFLLKHSSIYGFGTVIGQAVGFLLLPFYTRYLTPTDYGVMALVNITMDIIGIVAGLGISVAMSRFYFDFDTEKEKHLVVSTTYWILAVMIVVGTPALYFCSVPLSNLVFHTNNYSKLFLVASFSLLFGLIVDAGLTYLRIRAESTKYVKISLVRTVLLIGFNIFFIAVLKTGVIGIFYSSLINAVIFSICLTIPILLQTKLCVSINLSLKMARFSFPLVFSNIFRVLVNESDKYFINYFFSPLETGIYSISQKIGTSIHTLITSPFLQTYMPRRFEIMKQRDAKNTYASILNYYLLIICTVGLLLSLFSSEIIKIMTTVRFYSAARYIPLVVLSMIIFGMKYHFEIGIMIQKKTKYIAYINGVSCIVNIILNYLLISRYKLWGALIALNISYLTTTTLNLVFSQRLFYVRFELLKTLKIVLLVVSIYVLSTLINYRDIYLCVFLKSCLFFLYLIFLICLGLIKKESLWALKKTTLEYINSLLLKDRSGNAKSRTP